MFFSKNKKTGPSGYRFQNSKFRGRLKSAREYKREGRLLPQNFWQKIIYSLNLDSQRVQISAVLVLLLIIYLGYFSNPFSIKSVLITGLPEEQAQSAKDTALSYIDKNQIFAQKSLLFFSKKRASAYITANNQNVLSVISIEKDFPGTLKLELASRFEQFLVEEPGPKFLVLTNDGLISKTENASTSLASNLIKIALSATSSLSEREMYLDADKIKVLQTLANKLPSASGYELENFELPDFSSPDIVLITKKNGPKIYFDFYSDLGETIKNFNLLMSQVGQQDKFRLKYIDMRFQNRSFLCFINAPCAQKPMPEEASTTEETLLEN